LETECLHAVSWIESIKHLLSFSNYSDMLNNMKKSLIYFVSIFTAFIINSGSSIPALGMTPEIPFHAGEKMTFQITWSFIVAGEATVEVLPLTQVNGIDSYHILFTARTSEFVDIFYKVRDRIESYPDLNMYHSLLYIQSHHGKSHLNSRVDFDWGRDQAQYSMTGGGKKFAPISMPPGTFDPLSVFYAFRMNELKENNVIMIPVTDGKKMVMGKANVIRREVIEVGGIKYETFLVEPELGEIGGVFEKSKDAKLQIWVTTGNRHIPVRIKSKVKVGSFLAELTSYEEGIGTETGNN
jgi:hypothetical protein